MAYPMGLVVTREASMRNVEAAYPYDAAIYRNGNKPIRALPSGIMLTPQARQADAEGPHPWSKSILHAQPGNRHGAHFDVPHCEQSE